MQTQQDQNSQRAGFTLPCIAFDKLWGVFSESEGNLKVPRQVCRLVIDCLPVPWACDRFSFASLAFHLTWWVCENNTGIFPEISNFLRTFLFNSAEIRDACDGMLTNWLHFSSCREACNRDLESAFYTKLSQTAFSCNTLLCWPVLGGDVGEDLAGAPLLREGQQARSPHISSGWPPGC